MTSWLHSATRRCLYANTRMVPRDEPSSNKEARFQSICYRSFSIHSTFRRRAYHYHRSNWWHGAHFQTSCWCWKFQKEYQKVLGHTDHRPIGWFLGFQIERDWKNRTISINQHAYIESLAEKYKLVNAKPVKTLIKPGTQYSFKQCPSTPNQVAKMKGICYNEAIGSILWPAVASRPDIAYATRILSQFLQNPGYIHCSTSHSPTSTAQYWVRRAWSTRYRSVFPSSPSKTELTKLTE